MKFMYSSAMMKGDVELSNVAWTKMVAKERRASAESDGDCDCAGEGTPLVIRRRGRKGRVRRARGGIETMRFGDGDALGAVDVGAEVGSDELTELRKLECRCKSGLVAGRLDTPDEAATESNRAGRRTE